VAWHWHSSGIGAEEVPVKRVLVTVLVVVTAGLGLAQTPEVKRKSGGTLRAVFNSDPPTLDPAHATDLTSSAVIRQVFDGLLELDEQLTPVPALARRFTVSADQRVYTFTLQPGVRFHNGRTVTAADVKYSFERAAKGKRPWVFEKISGARAFISGSAGDISGIRLVDDLTVELRLDQPFAPFLFLIAYDAASIVPREVADQRGGGLASHPWAPARSGSCPGGGTTRSSSSASPSTSAARRGSTVWCSASSRPRSRATTSTSPASWI
jgi:ABC-type transport system substrate-binding protein